MGISLHLCFVRERGDMPNQKTEVRRQRSEDGFVFWLRHPLIILKRRDEFND
jgi:hypothetical protein